MAAAANKPGAVHYTLAFFVALAVVLGITNYMSYQAASEKTLDNLKLTDENQKLNKGLRTYQDEILALKKVIGINLDAVDDPTKPDNQATVVASLRTEMATQGKNVAGATVVETLRKLREANDNTAADRDSKTTKLASVETELRGVKAQYQNQVDNYSGQAKTAQREKQNAIGEFGEKIDAKVQDINRLSSENKNAQIQLAEQQDASDRRINNLTGDIGSLETRINFYRDKIDNMEKLSFEEPDGLINLVDYGNRTVLINLGEADFLKPRMTFSVYDKDNPGVARGVENIKGKIEVTRILGPHLARATIIDEDLYRPIMKEDQIYTPIWSPGLSERISVIGKIDLDNDGRSDRELFHQMMADAGCMIDNEVDDNGDRIPPDGKITVQTRFLVKADVPDLANALTDDEKERAKKMQHEYKVMEDEARKNGVRVVKLNDFLAYIGFHSKRRTFLTGQDRPFSLKVGSKGVLDTAGSSTDRTSNGNVSKVFTKKRHEKQDVSNGNTSKAYSAGDK